VEPARRRTRAGTNCAPAHLDPEESTMSARPILMGELGLLSLFDLVQLLMLNGASGTLRVVQDGRIGQMRFERGQMAGAVDEHEADGVEAAFRLFTWRTGLFEFRVGSPGGSRTIHDSTEGLMLEAARRMDEATAKSGGGFHTTSLQTRLQALSSWRSALDRLGVRGSTPEPEAESSPTPALQPVSAPKPKRAARRRRATRRNGYRDAA
jgi:hypothetical protein